jgi:hypothetical protein
MWRVCDQNVSANPYLHTCVDGLCVRVSQQLVCRLISWEKQGSHGSRSPVAQREARPGRWIHGGQRFRLGGGDEREEEAAAEVIGGGAGGDQEDGFAVVGILDWEAAVREKSRRWRR